MVTIPHKVKPVSTPKQATKPTPTSAPKSTPTAASKTTGSAPISKPIPKPATTPATAPAPTSVPRAASAPVATRAAAPASPQPLRSIATIAAPAAKSSIGLIITLSLVTILLVGGGVFGAIYLFGGDVSGGDATNGGGIDDAGLSGGTSDGGGTSATPVSIIPDDAPATFNEETAAVIGCNYTDSDSGFDIGIKGTCTDSAPHVDSCADNSLTEYFLGAGEECLAGCKNQTQACGDGFTCTAGACIAIPDPDDPCNGITCPNVCHGDDLNTTGACVAGVCEYNTQDCGAAGCAAGACLGGGGDADTDGDGVIDTEDEFPDDPAEWQDTDSDGVGDNADSDDDNDGWSDNEEIADGTDPKDPNDYPTDPDDPPAYVDSDGDGIFDVDDENPASADWSMECTAIPPSADGDDCWHGTCSEDPYSYKCAYGGVDLGCTCVLR